jgi:hypothetical protein
MDDETAVRVLREAAHQLQRQVTIAVDSTVSAMRYAANRLFCMHELAKRRLSEMPSRYRVVVWQSLTGGWGDGETFAENLTEYEAHVKWLEAYQSLGGAVGMRVQIFPMNPSLTHERVRQND